MRKRMEIQGTALAVLAVFTAVLGCFGQPLWFLCAALWALAAILVFRKAARLPR